MKVESIAKDNGSLYVQYLKRNNKALEDGKSSLEAFIDVYELESGNYVHSIALPVPARGLVVRDKRLYLISDKDRQVLAFKIKS